MLRARDASVERATAPFLRHQPEEQRREGEAHDKHTRTRVLPHQPQPIWPPEQPDLGSVERGDEAEDERLVAMAVEMAFDANQHRRHHQALGVAERARR